MLKKPTWFLKESVHKKKKNAVFTISKNKNLSIALLKLAGDIQYNECIKAVYDYVRVFKELQPCVES